MTADSGVSTGLGFEAPNFAQVHLEWAKLVNESIQAHWHPQEHCWE